jgi:tRNA pseudouridine55 synthase
MTCSTGTKSQIVTPRPTMPTMNGILVIDKPPNLTSHDVVARLRHVLHERRIGHTGTLDPFATGVLVILVGKATRLAQFFSGVDKEYEAIIRLGFATDTGDRIGKPIPFSPSTEQADQRGRWTEEEIELALNSLKGFIEQVPPMFSAKKRGGKKLYELARQGQEIHREPSRVCIHEFEAIRPDGQLMKDNLDGTFDFEVRVVCSSGTYIRTLAEDFGKRLGIGAHLAELRRTRVGMLTSAEAATLEKVKLQVADEGIGELLLDSNSALSWLPFMHLSDEDERRVRHGMEVKVEQTDWQNGDRVRMCGTGNELVAIGEFDAEQNRVLPRIVLTEEVKSAGR